MQSANVTIIGADEVRGLLDKIQMRIEEVPAYLAKQTSDYMIDVVHVITGYLKSTIHPDGPWAIADAYYAGFEADRGWSHDFPELALGHLTAELIAGKIVP